MQRVQLEENAIVAIDDEHVPIAVGVRIISGQPSFDPLLLRLRFLRDRIAGRAAGAAESL